MVWNDGLAGVALQIAETDDSPLRVIAGPGTGKTYAMKKRVARLLFEAVDPARILAVTFTRTAAADIVRELNELGVDGCDQIHAGTLHSYCFSLLNKAEVFEFLGRSPRPLITFKTYGVLRFEAEPLLEDLNKKTLFGNKKKRTDRIRAFDAAWARLQSDEPGWAQNPVDQQFEEDLVGWLKFHNSMLVGELVPQALNYLRNNPECVDLGAFDHVIVDEYQDLNKAEQVLLDMLAAHASSVVVGDRDQSIYSFRHAHPDGIVEFAETHPHTHDEELLECRRCPLRVVTIANHLILRNYPPGEPAHLHPMPGNANGEIQIVQWPSLEDQTQGIADYVKHLIDDRGYLPKDIMILSPRRLIGYAIRDELLKKNIAVHSFYHEEMLEEEIVQINFALLTLAADPTDRVALRFWLGFGSPSWRAGGYAKIREYCNQTGESPWQVLEGLESGAIELSGTTELLKRFVELKAQLTALEPLIGIPLLDYLFAESPETEAVREAALLAGAVEMDARQMLASLTSVITQPAMPESGDFARIMSLHKSKGLTSKVVIVAGCIEGLIPYLEDDWTPNEKVANIKEQRRLFYVALTRATEVLVISSFAQIERKLAHKIGAKVGGYFGKSGPTVNSRFLTELGPTAPQAKPGSLWREKGFV